MATDQKRWTPDWAVHPGEVLAETLEERSISQSDLARRLGRPIKTVNEIINGKAALTPETAIQLEHTLGISASFWNGLESTYRESLARQRAESSLGEFTEWAGAFPTRDLIKHGVIERADTPGGRVAALLSYFGVGSPSAWDGLWLSPSASFRKSPAFASSPHAVAAWLRWGEIEALKVEAEVFNLSTFKRALGEIRGLTRVEPFASALSQTVALCANAGVVVVLTPELDGARLSGASRWLGRDRALIQLSLRYKTDDQFWFTFFHEAAHLLEGDRRDLVEGDESDAAEEQADTDARNLLLPLGPYSQFVAAKRFGERDVRDFARSQGVGAGIVVGRLQREGHLARTALNKLKKPLRWAV